MKLLLNQVVRYSANDKLMACCFSDVDGDGDKKQRPNLLDDVEDDQVMLDEVKSSFEMRQQRVLCGFYTVFMFVIPLNYC